ncbi:MAG: anti-sigma factor [Alphaproteobacteria bacterium]|nr:anti-sigma factor [Alphaproteobacteria bacterium]
MERITRIDDVMLMAYVDGEVDAETAREIEASIAADPAIGRRVAMFRQTATMMRGAFGEVLHEPVPARLVQALGGATAAPAAAAAMLPLRGRTERPGYLWRNAGWAAAAAIGAVALLNAASQQGIAPFSQRAPVQEVAAVIDAERWIDNLAAWYRVHRASFEKDHRLLVDIGAENVEELERWVGAKLQREVAVPDLSSFGYRQQGGRLLLIGRRPAAQFFYAAENGELVQLVIGFTDQPDREGRLDQRDEVNVVSWREKGYAYAFIGRIDGRRLWAMADATWAKLKPA